MTVEILRLTQPITEDTLYLRTTLHHLLTHAQLSILNLLYFPQIIFSGLLPLVLVLRYFAAAASEGRLLF